MGKYILRLKFSGGQGELVICPVEKAKILGDDTVEIRKGEWVEIWAPQTPVKKRNSTISFWGICIGMRKADDEDGRSKA